MKKKLVSKIKERFKSDFQSKPIIIGSPGRINLIGEHTDYNEGFVFPAAINKGIVLAIDATSQPHCTVVAFDLNEQYKIDLKNVRPIKNGGWRNYVLGVISEVEKRGIKVKPFNAVFGGNIPAGSGMSSSAALENSFVFGLNECFNLGLSRKEMIVVSQKAEHNFAGVQCGIMDQYASMFGVKNSALLLDCRSLEKTTYNIDLGNYCFVLINTNVKHELSESAYNDRRKVCEKVAQILNIPALRDAAISDLEIISDKLSVSEYEKAQYVIEENNRVREFASAIENNDLEKMGQLLYESHNGLSKKYKVSCPELDFLVSKAKQYPEVLGARMMGGGFGGCTINLVLKGKRKQFTQDISQSYLAEFGFECSAYKVKLSEGTKLLQKN